MKHTKEVKELVSTITNWDSVEDQITSLVKILVKGKINYGAILSRPGLGKSFIVERILKGTKTKYKQISGYCTPLEFYKMLYDNRDEFVFIDDTQGIMDNTRSRSILMAAVWAATGNNRRITYASSTSKLDDVPKSFEFKGKILICANEIPRKCEALKSRGFSYSFDFSRDEVITKMKEISSSKKLNLEVVDYIEEITTMANLDLNLRDMVKAYEVYRLNKDWKKIVCEQIKADPEYIVLIDSLSKFKTYVDQCSYFCKLTGLSKSTFVRRKRRIKNG